MESFDLSELMEEDEYETTSSDDVSVEIAESEPVPVVKVELDKDDEPQTYKSKFGCRASSNCPPNMAYVMRNTETFGCPPRKMHKFPRKFIQGYQGREMDRLNLMPKWVYRLHCIVESDEYDLQDSRFIAALEHILALLLNETLDKSSAMFFAAAGGIEVIADLLIKPFFSGNEDIDNVTEVIRVQADDLVTVKYMLQILYHCSQVIPVGVSQLCNRPHLMHLLFSLHAETEKRVFTDATMLLEEMILSGPCKPEIDMRKIACLP